MKSEGETRRRSGEPDRPEPAEGEPAARILGEGGELVLYATGKSRLEVRLDEDTVWLSQLQLAELFGRDKSVISRHLRNVFQSGELARDSAVALFATVQEEGGRAQVEHFNLDAILSVGYRADSKQGTRFRGDERAP